ncbi:MAG: hypothetical protein U9Q30_03445 [Campylobacterota bacterium]|nr:hypothetical protein [Campylobacterota bacterium]
MSKDITKCTNNGDIKLVNINKDNKTTYYENRCYKIYGLPFYNKDMEDDFKKDFKALLLEDI